jgi:sugar/nucleoside kinase (ribokinase family)
MNVLVCGSTAFDSIKLPSVTTDNEVGGAGVYASVAASIFAPTRLASSIGIDFSEDFLNVLKGKGVDLSLVQKSNKKTFHWTARYSNDLSECVVVNREFGADADFKPSLLKGKVNDVQVAFLAKIDPKIQLEVISLLPKKTIIIIESAPRWTTTERNILKEVLKRTDVFMVSSEEAGLLVDVEPSVPHLIEQILQMGPKVVVFKKGEFGLTMYGKMGNMVVPSYPFAYAVDPTGAGDVLGGSIAGVLAKLGTFDTPSLKKAVLIGSTMASFTVEDYGLNSLLRVTYEEVINRTKLFLNQLPAAHLLPLEKSNTP